jgi:uncharacterized protein (UPF0261 family)
MLSEAAASGLGPEKVAAKKRSALAIAGAHGPLALFNLPAPSNVPHRGPAAANWLELCV